MGIQMVEEKKQLLGILSTTLVAPEHSSHVSKYISFVDDPNDLYDRNIQIAELNSLNAALAIIKWKKFLGFYQDLEKEHNSTYTLNTNQLISEEIPTPVC
jgi:hypothetical protein